MGVPKFYRWVSERYPCLSEVVKEFQIPEFDNLYLDMNGIIHVCSHPEDDNPHFRITEEKIFKDIMHYLEFLFRMIKPRKVFFMAVDGVAPRAKMNQQRGRRFRSAREAEELERKAREKGEDLPTEKRFDSNCITPGTPFMVRLQDQLKYFVVNKLSTDPLWEGVRVYLSGHETPGEGEHKIMDFIRAERSKPDYDPNTRHCLHGLDADLMMLGLATHEPHFSLLREEVRFGGKRDKTKRPATPEETTFHLLHLSLFREYLDFEFSALKEKLPFPYDLENIIDDWVLMGFLVGNDFIPHLPNLHINHDALPLLWQTYIEVLPTCGGYLNTGGHLNLDRFEKYLTALSKFDFDTFSEQVGDLKWLEAKKGEASVEQQEMLSAARKFRKNAKKAENHFAALLDLPVDDVDGYIDTGLSDDDTSPEELSEENVLSEEDSDEDTLDDEFRHHKRAYYMDKMEYEKVTPEVLRDQAEGYVRGIQWILLYYYEGVPSWSWFYPHHYAPYMSDVKDFKDMDIKYDLGTPFLPFEQLMAVLPSASKELLPPAYQSLMTTASSPVIDFYPVDFSTDLNGKQQDWEAVVLIPFIDENRLLSAMRAAEVNLTPEERQRNSHGPCCLYEYSTDVLETYPSSLPGVFPDIVNNHARLTKVPKDAFWLKSSEMVKGLLKGTKLDVFYPGFPTLKHIPHKSELAKKGVKVFQMNSRGYNVMLHIEEQDEPDIQRVAKEYLGKEIYVGWPHLYEAKVIAVCNDEVSHTLVEPPQAKGSKSQQSQRPSISVDRSDENTANIWHREVESIRDKYEGRLGIIVGDTHVLLRALPMTGRRYIFGSHGRITMSKQFGNQPVPFVLQATVKDIAVHDPSFCQFKTLTEYLPDGCPVFMLGWPHYGCQGEVLEVDGESGRVRVNLTIFEEPKVSGVLSNQQLHDERYYSGYVASQRLGISSSLFGRMTGTILVCAGEAELAREQQNPHKVNVGLNLKFTKRGEEIPGYTKLTEGQWSYSEKTIQVAREYMAKFPEMWTVISKADRKSSDIFYESDVIPKDSGYDLKAISKYKESLPCHGLKSMKSGADIISEGMIKALESEADKVVELNKKRQKRVKMQVKPHLLFRPLRTAGSLIPDSSATYQLLDRVVNIRQGYCVPFGLRGTVIGIHPSEVEVNSMFEVLFDEEFSGSISIRNSSMRGYRMPPSSLLNLTHGERKNGVKPALPTQSSTQQTGNHYGHQSQQYGNQSQYGRQNQQYGNQPRNVTGDYSYASASQSNYHRNQSGHQGQQGGYYNQARPGNQDSFYPSWNKNQSEWNRQNQVANQKPGDKNSGQKKVEKTSNSSEEFTSNVFNGSSSSGSQPKFVTPRVTSSGTSQRRTSQGDTKQEKSSSNSDFDNIWKQLQSSAMPTATETDQSKSPVSQETSLAQAASVLPSVSNTAKKSAERDEENTNNNNKDSANTKIDVQSLFNKASNVSTLEEVEKAAAASEAADKKNKGGTSKVVSNDEFAAMFKSLSEVELSEEEDSEGKNDQEDSAVMIKKMLKITSGPETEPSGTSPEPGHQPNKSYGRQVSIQELFEGAKKQQEQSGGSKPQGQSQGQGQGQTSKKGQGSQGNEKSRQHQGSQGQQQQQQQNYQNQKRPTLLMPQSKGGNRNPVMELMSFCQSLQIGLPMYDYMVKSGQHFCVVTLFNGQSRYSGSLCKTREEAAESAAGLALLQLKGSVQAMPGHPMMRMQGFVPPGVLPQGRQFSSPNSAFSPVSNFAGNYNYQGQGGYGRFQNPQQRPYGQGGYQQHSRGGNRSSNYGNQNQSGGNYGNQNQSGGNYGNQNQSGNDYGNYGNQENTQNYQYNQSSGRQQHHQQQMPQQNSSTNQSVFKKKEEGAPLTNQKTGGTGLGAGGEVKSQPTCVVSPFIPLQVTKKQTPQKGRKESVSDDTPTKSEEKISQEPSVASCEASVSAGRVSKDNSNSQISDKSSDVKNKSTKESDSTQFKTPPRQENVNNSASPSDSAPKTASAKKSRRRLAANFNFQ